MLVLVLLVTFSVAIVVLLVSSAIGEHCTAAIAVLLSIGVCSAIGVCAGACLCSHICQY